MSKFCPSYRRLRECQHLINLLTCADRDNHEISIYSHDSDRSSGVLHRAVCYERYQCFQEKKTVVHIFCSEQNVIRCHRNVGAMCPIFQQDVFLTFNAVRPPALEKSAILCYHLWFAPLYHTLSHYLIKGTILEKKSYKTQEACFDFLYNFSLKHFSV